MITLKQFTGQNITPTDDATLYELFSSSQAGIIYGCNVTSLGANQLQVSAGRGMILGRSFVVEQETILAELAPSGNMKGRLSIKIDLGNAETPISFETQVGSVLPSPTQDQLNRGGSVYEMPLAEYDVDAIQISNVTMVAENVYMASPWGETTATASTGEGAVSITSKLKGMKEISFISPKEYNSKDTYTLNGQQIELKDIKGGALSDAAWAANVPVQLMVNAGIGYLMGGVGGGAGPKVGMYTGDGETLRDIVLGFNPKILIVFRVGELFKLQNITSAYFAIGVIDESGTALYSEGIYQLENGFKVYESPGSSPTGYDAKLNSKGKKYAYIVW